MIAPPLALFSLRYDVAESTEPCPPPPLTLTCALPKATR